VTGLRFALRAKGAQPAVDPPHDAKKKQRHARARCR